MALDAALGAPAADRVGERSTVVDAIDNVREERLSHKDRGALEQSSRLVQRMEAGRQHDAIRIIDGYRAARLQSSMSLDLQVETKVRCRHFHPVERPGPCRHDKPRFLLHLACQRFDEGLTCVNDATGGAPVDGVVSSFVLDQEEPAGCIENDTASDTPLPECSEFIGSQCGHRISVEDRSMGRSYACWVSDHQSDPDSSSIEPAGERDLATPGMPFDSLTAPQPIRSAPPAQARWLGFAGILVGGALGGMIGWGTGDVLGQTTTWAAIGALIGAVFGAAGVGIVATLTLRAMNEWNAVQHPEAIERDGIIGESIDTETDTS